MLAALGREAEGAENGEEEVREEGRPRLTGRRKGAQCGKRLVLPKEVGTRNWSPEQRLLILDAWRRSGLPAGDFASPHFETLRRFLLGGSPRKPAEVFNARNA